jgi:hypothetical protein
MAIICTQLKAAINVNDGWRRQPAGESSVRVG